MRRKLVSLDVFDRIESDSLSQAEYELAEAANILAQNLESGPLTFAFFDDEKVVYETDHGTFIHANYTLKENALAFDDITELVIDQESQKKRLRECVKKMVEAVIDGNENEANLQFQNYVTEYMKARKSGATQVAEEVVVRVDNRSGGKVTKQIGSSVDKRNAARAAWRKSRGKMLAARRRREVPSNKLKEKKKHQQNKLKGAFRKVNLIRTGKASKMMKEWYNLCENVNGYLQFVENNIQAPQVDVKHNDQGDVTSVTMPTAKNRNEGKILSLQYKTLKTDVKVLREAARGLSFDEGFVKAVAHIKRLNNMTLNNELEESISDLVRKHPGVLYLTQEELAKVIGKALDHAGQVNYDDQTCAFMAEGILRVAHGAFTDRVNRIAMLAGAEVKAEGEQDEYQQFQAVIKDFYPKLDESLGTEMQVFTDLYNTLVDVRRLAMESDNSDVRDEATEYLTELKSVLEGKQQPALELAEEVAVWLQDLVENNLAGATDSWSVSNSTHHTIVGDHPQMAKNAKVPGNPGSHTGDWGDSAPVSDGKSYKGGEADQMRNHGWGNKGGKDTWPSLNNPYTPHPFGDYTMKGEKGVDKGTDDALGQDGGNDTWPSLQNPYVPREVGGEGGKGYKMKSDNLVVDK